MMPMSSVVLAGVGGLGLCASAIGAINPFTETFSSSAASWSSSSVFTALNYPASGGPDGSGYGSGSFGFSSASNGSPIALFRCQDNFGSSGNSFFGNWQIANISTLTFSVRHNAPFSLGFFGRFVGAGSPVGAAYADPAVLVAPNTWTTLSIPIDLSNPNWQVEGFPPAPLFNSTFANVARVQIGVMVDSNLAGQAGPYTFDIDNVSVTPAPGGAAMLLGVAGLGCLRRRRS